MFTNNPLEIAYIYVLCDPRTQEICYVGRTDSPKQRYLLHTHPKELAKPSAKNTWLLSLLSNGIAPEMLILSHVPKDDAQYWEQFWLNSLRRLGIKLVNSRDAIGGRRSNSAKKAKLIREKKISSASSLSGYRGVRWSKQKKRWYAMINIKGKQIYLGLHDDIVVLAKRYDAAAKEYLGKRARLNFPDED